MLKWHELFLPKILQRGRECAENSAVWGLGRGAAGWEAVVVGTELYPVEISIERGEITRAECGCPFAEKGMRCKHMAAVLYCMEERWPEVMADRDDALSRKLPNFSSDEVDTALKLAIDVLSMRCTALLLNRSNGDDYFSPDEFTLDDLPAEYGQQEKPDRQGRNEPLRLLYPDATEEKRREISRKYGLDGA